MAPLMTPLPNACPNGPIPGSRGGTLRKIGWQALVTAAWLTGTLGLQTAHGQAPPPEAASAPASAAAPAPTVVSSTGQQIYAQMRPRLLQVRTLLKTQDSQSSVGSGFLVSDQGHLITNYHVIRDRKSVV